MILRAGKVDCLRKADAALPQRLADDCAGSAQPLQVGERGHPARRLDLKVRQPLDGFVQQHIRQSLQLGFLSAGGDTQEAADSYPENLYSLADRARFPLLLAGASEAMPPDEDDDFFATELEFGLRTILDGVERLVTRAR